MVGDLTQGVGIGSNLWAAENTDRHLWPIVSEIPFPDSIHVTKDGGIGINVGGRVFVKPLKEWHRLAAENATLTARLATIERETREALTYALHDLRAARVLVREVLGEPHGLNQSIEKVGNALSAIRNPTDPARPSNQDTNTLGTGSKDRTTKPELTGSPLGTPNGASDTSTPSEPASEQPVAWRWKYADQKAWTLSKHQPKWFADVDVDCEPLYAAPASEHKRPESGASVHDK